jgi:Family of unknown function (DUF6286)
MKAVINSLLALIVALFLVAVAIVVIIEVIANLVGSDWVLVDWPAAYAWAQRTLWSDTVVKTIGLLLVVAGLALVVGELWPSRIRRLPVDSPEPATDAAITRRGLAQDVTTAVNEVDGVTPARVRVGRRRITVQAAASKAAEDSVAVRDAVTTSVQGRLDRLRLRRRPRLAVNVSRRP